MPIKTLSPWLCVALCACAASSTPVREDVVVDCDVREPVTGSQIVRRERCVVSTEESRAEARRQLEMMQEAQRKLRPPKMGGGGG